jgi:hypothetical protein
VYRLGHNSYQSYFSKGEQKLKFKSVDASRGQVYSRKPIVAQKLPDESDGHSDGFHDLTDHWLQSGLLQPQLHPHGLRTSRQLQQSLPPEQLEFCHGPTQRLSTLNPAPPLKSQAIDIVMN